MFLQINRSAICHLDVDWENKLKNLLRKDKNSYAKKNKKITIEKLVEVSCIFQVAFINMLILCVLVDAAISISERHRC